MATIQKAAKAVFPNQKLASIVDGTLVIGNGLGESLTANAPHALVLQNSSGGGVDVVLVVAVSEDSLIVDEETGIVSLGGPGTVELDTITVPGDGSVVYPFNHIRYNFVGVRSVGEDFGTDFTIWSQGGK